MEELRPTPGDPRDYLRPEVTEKITDEAVNAWRQGGVCLCGCGEKCAPRTTGFVGLPRGTLSFFRRGHMFNLYKPDRTPHNLDEWRRARALAHIRRCRRDLMDSAGISYLLNEYLNATGETVRTFGKRVGMPPTSVSAIRAYSKKRITKPTFVKLMVGINEPLPWGFGQYVPPGMEYKIAREERDAG